MCQKLLKGNTSLLATSFPYAGASPRQCQQLKRNWHLPRTPTLVASQRVSALTVFVSPPCGDKVLLIIELDDQSHNNIERIERDKFVDDNLTACGYKIVHTRGAIDVIEKELQAVTRNASVSACKENFTH